MTEKTAEQKTYPTINPVNIATLVFRDFLKGATKEQLIAFAQQSYEITMKNARKHKQRREAYERFTKNL